MRVVVQRVRYARVRVNGALVAGIGPGLLVFAGFAGSDSPEVLSWMARKVVNLRVFPDEHGRMNRSLQEVGGELLVVSQFTLYGDVQRGFRPSFTDAAPPEQARTLYEHFLAECRHALGRAIAAGIFGAMMEVELLNDGPVTIWIERGAGG